MMSLVQGLERWHTVNGTYVGFPTATVSSPNTGTAAYTIVPSGLTATGYTLTATAVNDQVHDDCGDITLTQTGTPTFTGGTAADCWSR
jgi:type IV pilus assembly protein PilE